MLWRYNQGRIKLAKSETGEDDGLRDGFFPGRNENVLSWEGARVCKWKDLSASVWRKDGGSKAEGSSKRQRGSASVSP